MSVFVLFVWSDDTRAISEFETFRYNQVTQGLVLAWSIQAALRNKVKTLVIGIILVLLSMLAKESPDELLAVCLSR